MVTLQTLSILIADSKDDIIVYPNPAVDKISVSIKNGNIKNIRITGIEGKQYINKEVGSLQREEIQLSELPSGTYFITIFDGTNVSTRKISLIK